MRPALSAVLPADGRQVMGLVDRHGVSDGAPAAKGPVRRHASAPGERVVTHAVCITQVAAGWNPGRL